MQSISYLGLDFPDLLDEGLKHSFTFLVGPLNFALSGLDPADGSSQIYTHEVVLLLVHKGDGVANIFFVTDLMVLGILVQSGLVLAHNRIVLIVVTLAFTPHQRELQVGAG